MHSGGVDGTGGTERGFGVSFHGEMLYFGMLYFGILYFGMLYLGMLYFGMLLFIQLNFQVILLFHRNVLFSKMTKMKQWK